MTVVDVNIPQLQDARDKLATFQATIKTLMADVDSAMARVTWSGTDRDAYTAEQAKVVQAVADLDETLNKTSRFVDEVATGYIGIKRYGEQLFGG